MNFFYRSIIFLILLFWGHCLTDLQSFFCASLFSKRREKDSVELCSWEKWVGRKNGWGIVQGQNWIAWKLKRNLEDVRKGKLKLDYIVLVSITRIIKESKSKQNQKSKRKKRHYQKLIPKNKRNYLHICKQQYTITHLHSNRRKQQQNYDTQQQRWYKITSSDQGNLPILLCT